MVQDPTEGRHCCIERSFCWLFPLRQVTSEVVAPTAVVRRRAGNTATRISSSNRRCLGDNCQSSAQTAPVGSRQLRLGGHSVECGLAGCSKAWWNDPENDHQSKQREQGSAAAAPGQAARRQGRRLPWRPRVLRRRGIMAVGEQATVADDQLALGRVDSRPWRTLEAGPPF
jgi:hypothetical protein